jgi:hypothetical protein
MSIQDLERTRSSASLPGSANGAKWGIPAQFGRAALLRRLGKLMTMILFGPRFRT